MTVREACRTVTTACDTMTGFTVEAGRSCDDWEDYTVGTAMGPLLYVRISDAGWHIMTGTNTHGMPRATPADLRGTAAGPLRDALFNLQYTARRVLIQCRGAHWNDPPETP